VSRGLGIVVSPPLSRTVLEHIRFVLLPDGRVVVVLVSNGGLTRDKVVRVDQQFAQEELDRTAEHLNRHYVGWTLDAIRTDLAARVQRDRERYDRLVRNALTLCDPALLETSGAPQVYLEGAAQIATAPEFAGQEELRELLGAIEEKTRLVALLTGCVEDPEPVHVQIGVAELSGAGQYLSLISAPYACNDYLQGSLGVLGPIRMHYERAITVVAHVARIFGDNLHRSGA
jgi:heat-inducible transcriptional repressor